MPCDMPDAGRGSSPASAGFARPLLFFREVTREVMVPPCEVTHLACEVTVMAAARRAACNYASFRQGRGLLHSPGKSAGSQTL
jgi:hypothetical protein